MSSAVTTATIAAVTSNMSSLPTATATGLAVLLLLIVFLVGKEVLVSSVRPEILATARYLNVVIAPLLLAFALIGTFCLGVATGFIH